MKTDVDTCLKDLAAWFVKNRREMTELEFDEVLRQHCVSEAEVKKMEDFIESKQGTLRFKTLLQERRLCSGRPLWLRQRYPELPVCGGLV